MTRRFGRSRFAVASLALLAGAALGVSLVGPASAGVPTRVATQETTPSTVDPGPIAQPPLPVGPLSLL